jgi:hypothetical protein
LVPLTLDFGSVAKGAASVPLAVTLTNNQNTALPVAGITISNSQFTETDNCATVAPFGHCTISVTFTPAAIGGQNGIMTVNDGFASTPTSPQSVQLFGIGNLPPTPVSP